MVGVSDEGFVLRADGVTSPLSRIGRAAFAVSGDAFEGRRGALVLFFMAHLVFD